MCSRAAVIVEPSDCPLAFLGVCGVGSLVLGTLVRRDAL